MKLAVLATVRDEASYLVDWVAHLKALGIQGVFVFENDSVDGTEQLLSALHDAGHLTHIPNAADAPMRDKFRTLPPQRRAYARAVKTPGIQAADYVLTLDADEVLELPLDDTLPAMLLRLEYPDVVSMPWRNMGGSGQAEFEAAPVTDRFDMAALPDRDSPIRSLRQVKSLYRPSISRYYNIHKPRAFRPDVRWVSPAGDNLKQHLHTNSHLDGFDYRFANLRHYHVKSRPEFAVKIVRGFGCTEAANRGQLGRAMYDLFDTNDVSLPMPTLMAERMVEAAAQMRADAKVREVEAACIERFQHYSNLCHQAVEGCDALRDVTLRYRMDHLLKDYFEDTVWARMRTCRRD